MSKNNTTIKRNLWNLLNNNRHLKDLPEEVKHLISSNVARSFKQYRTLQKNQILTSVKKILGND